MKRYFSTLVLFTFFSTLLFADIKVPRSIEDRLQGIGFMDQETTVDLSPGIRDFQNQVVTEVKLTSPHSSQNNDGAVFDSMMRKDENGTAHKRSIVLLSESSLQSLSAISVTDQGQKESQLAKAIRKEVRAKGGFDNNYIVANFVDINERDSEQQFYVAIIPKSVEVFKVIFQAEWFGSGAGGHNQIRIVLDQPITLIPQDGVEGAHTPKVLASDQYGNRADFVYSLQSIRVNGGKTEWSVIDGLLGEYANALQFYSIQAKAKRQIFNSVVKQYEITNLTGPQMKSIFLAALSNSNKLSDSTIYNTVLNSCITHAMMVLKGLKVNGEYQGIRGINTLWFNPYSVFRKLSETLSNPEFNPPGRRSNLRILDTLNTEYENDFPIPAGKKVLEENDLRQTQAYKLIQPLRNSLLQSDEFEGLVRKIALLINEKQYTSKQVVGFVEKIKAASEAGESPSLAGLTGESKALYLQISKMAKAQGLNNKEVLTALSALKTQE